jgi:hypothetical protein
MEKDIDLVLSAADDAGVDLPVTRHMKALLRAAVDAGYADDDLMALFLQLRNASAHGAPPLPVAQYPDQEVVR